MALFSSKKQEVSNVTNTTYSPTEISTTVGPTVSDYNYSSTSWKNTEISDSMNTVGSYNRSLSVSNPVLIAGAGAESLMRGTGLDLSNFFTPPKVGESQDSSPSMPLTVKILIGAVILFVAFKFLKR